MTASVTIGILTPPMFQFNNGKLSNALLMMVVAVLERLPVKGARGPALLLISLTTLSAASALTLLMLVHMLGLRSVLPASLNEMPARTYVSSSPTAIP